MFINLVCKTSIVKFLSIPMTLVVTLQGYACARDPFALVQVDFLQIAVNIIFEAIYVLIVKGYRQRN